MGKEPDTFCIKSDVSVKTIQNCATFTSQIFPYKCRQVAQFFRKKQQVSMKKLIKYAKETIFLHEQNFFYDETHKNLLDKAVLIKYNT